MTNIAMICHLLKLLLLVLCLCTNQVLSGDHHKQYDITKFCGKYSDDASIDLDDDLTSIGITASRYDNFIDCSLEVEVNKGYGIIVTVNRINLRPVVDHLEIDLNKSLKPVWTGSEITDSSDIVSYVTDRKVKINFKTGRSSESTKYKNFDINLTTYRLSTKCQKNEILCGHNRCISSKYRCDGNTVCEDLSDVTVCLADRQTSRMVAIIVMMAIVIALFLLCYCCGCCCCWCCCSSSSKKNNQKDYIQFDDNNVRCDDNYIDRNLHIIDNEPSTEPTAPLDYYDYTPGQHMRQPYGRYPLYPYNDRSSQSHNYLAHMPPPPPPYTPKAE